MASLVTLHSELARTHHEEILRQAARDRLASLGRGTRPTLTGRVRHAFRALRPARQRQADLGSSASARLTYTVAPTER